MGEQHQGLGAASMEVEEGGIQQGGGARWRGEGRDRGGGHKGEEVGDVRGC